MNSSIVEEYLESVARKYTNENTSEYGYRTDFENLLSSIFEKINVNEIEHDAKTKEGNKPDFIITKNKVPILYIETKNIGTNLDGIEKSSQMARYYGYDNLVLTDYLELRFYRNGERYEQPIIIGTFDKKNRKIISNPGSFGHLIDTLIEFTESHKEPIKSGLHLAKIMGGKARRIRENINQIFQSEAQDNELHRVYETIKQLLVHDLSLENFADMYSQTLVYGLFVARFYDKSLDNFSRIEARELIPASNPFLRHFFDHIAGPDFNKRLEIIVDELCEVFLHADVEKLMDDYYKKEKGNEKVKGSDPVVHFYEDFLKEYDPELRKKMGAYYTPEPVVNFIVKSVDEILKKDFGLKNGLADASKSENGIHKVQVLDPAVGTGTFFNAVIREIYKDFKLKKQEGRWPSYVHNDLLPRIHGFELMMAPYTIAHLKLSMAFKKTGFKYFNDRLGIYLTNSLEDIKKQEGLFAFGFAESIAKESEEAEKIKHKTPIMVVVGNPPYSVSSQNKGEWIENEMKIYKKDLNERNIQPLSDDYIKFIRFAEQFVEKNGSGIVAMITNNSFLDGVIHRQMRKHLLETFGDIYIVNLHGNSKKKEKAPDGSKDENVFDIQQGVSINIFVRKESQYSKRSLAEVFYYDLYGNREKKFNFINKETLKNIKWLKLDHVEPHYFFAPKDFSSEEEYKSGIVIKELFKVNGNGIKTNNDNFLVDFTKDRLLKKIDEFISERSVEKIRSSLKLTDGRYWNSERERVKIIENNNKEYHEYKYLYRPFDFRWIYYQPNLIEIGRGGASKKTMVNLMYSNYALIACKQYAGGKHFTTFITSHLTDMSSQPFAPYNIFPLYIYKDDSSKIPNFDSNILNQIMKFIGDFDPEQLLDYIYAVLHTPSYRTKYKEFLKIDFPRVPYPKDRKQFDELAKIGKELRELHLMESPKLQKATLPYPEAGSDIVEKVEYKEGRVYINSNQYFGKVSEIAWNFYIGGYQPAQKWLKDRKGRTLTNEDIEHYQKIIYILDETDKLMRKLDNIK